MPDSHRIRYDLLNQVPHLRAAQPGSEAHALKAQFMALTTPLEVVKAYVEAAKTKPKATVSPVIVGAAYQLGREQAEADRIAAELDKRMGIAPASSAGVTTSGNVQTFGGPGR